MTVEDVEARMGWGRKKEPAEEGLPPLRTVAAKDSGACGSFTLLRKTQQTGIDYTKRSLTDTLA